MPEYELISPFPEEDLPALWVWFQPYRYNTEYADLSEREFVEAKRSQAFSISWGILKDGELGAYIGFEPQGERVGFMELICKPQFFRFFRQETVIPAMREALSDVFKAGTSVVLFTPIERNGGMVKIFRSLGAKTAGSIVANGIPERRVLSIGSGDWRTN
jgi:hypothetical protein